MKLTEIVPWGRTLEEYRLMFDLSETDLKRKILGCGDGPASFNTEMNKLGHYVISIDPIYQFSEEQIKLRIQETYEVVISQVKKNAHDYIWNNFQNVDELVQQRLKAMEMFLLDYNTGKTEERYLFESLPKLSMSDNQFELSVCSHLLFLYSEQLSLNFHLDSIYELLRISKELRIFPLISLDGKPSPYMDIVIQNLLSQGFNVEIQTVPYEFQKGANQMLKIIST